jgi:two-component system, NtrC family, sensor histidine kinase GlrK
MSFTIFSRLILGYLFISILLLSTSIYAVFQLHQFESVTRSLIDVDERMLDYEKKLSDSLLSQMRYERKFTLTKDPALHDQFRLSSRDFANYLDRAFSLADRPLQKDILNRIKSTREDYQSLIARETKDLQENQPYDQERYKQEKNRAVDRILEELKILADDSQKNSSAKIRMLGEVGAKARKIALSISVMALLGVLIISLIITRSITKPLSVLIHKTRQIANWVFQGDLHISSPPEIRDLSQAINSMCDRLREVDRMKTDFFSKMSHELRTPLTSIKEGTSILLDGIGGELNEKQKKILTIISRESRRLIDLVNSILDLAKLEAGMMTFNFKREEIIPLIHQAIDEIKPYALAKEILLQEEGLLGLPLTRMDNERILQVLRNFLGNAVKFTPPGGRVTVSAVAHNGGLRVCVQDTGPGIARENLAIIFERFHQGSLGHPGQIKGSGLGLAIAKQIVTAHGGKIWAESEPGRGSSFIFLLPA